MIFLVYIGILLLCYGLYNIAAYYFMLPTAAAGSLIKRFGRGEGIIYVNPFIMELSREVVKKLDLDGNGRDTFSEILRYNRIYYSVAVYCVSVILTMLCGLFFCFPLLFWDKIWFLIAAAGVLLYIVTFNLILVSRYRKSVEVLEKTVKKNSVHWLHTAIRLTPMVFFLCQMILILTLLT